jgi:hypothetical protein
MPRSQANLQFDVFEGLRGLSIEGKLLYFELLVEPTINQAGVGALRERRWAKDTELGSESTERAMEELEAKNYALFDSDTEEAFVRTIIRRDGVAEKPNLLWAACRAAVMVKSPRIRQSLASELRKLPPKPAPTIGKNGRPYEHPDPHATADFLDPPKGPSGVRPEPTSNGSTTVRNPPTPNGSGTIAEPFGAEPFDIHSRTPGGGGGGGGSVPACQSVSSSSSDTATPQPDKQPVDEPQRDDVDAICNRLRDWLIQNEVKTPTITKEWRRQARLMLDRDKRELSKALNLIDWCQQDKFWKANIHSVPTFRDQYDKLALRAREEWRANGERAKASADAADPSRSPWADVQRYTS